MTRDRNDPLRPLAVLFAAAAAVFLLFALIARCAIAGSMPAEAPPAPVVAVAFDWKFYLALTLAALAGVRTVLEAVAAILRIVAPRTKTTLDDRALALDDAARAKLDEFIGIAKTLQPPKAPIAMLAILVLGLAGGVALPACGGSQSSRAATIGSLDSGARTAIAALRTYEHERAEAAIANAPNLAAGKATLAALRARTAPAWKAIDAALYALDAANTINDDPSLRSAQAAIGDAIAAVAALTGGSP